MRQYRLLVTRKQRVVSLSGHVNLSREVLYQVPVLAAERKERKNLKKQRKVKDFSNSTNVL